MKTYLTIEKCDAYMAIANNNCTSKRFDEIVAKSTIKNTYKFSELNEEQQQKALDRNWNININHDWWDSDYDDAETIGVKIEGFDLEHRNIGGKLLFDIDTICDKIIKNHGEGTDTFKLAYGYKEASSKIIDDDDYDDNYNALTDDFKEEILDVYFHILQKSYEYLTSKEGIIETIEANDYDFNEEGEIC